MTQSKPGHIIIIAHIFKNREYTVQSDTFSREQMKEQLPYCTSVSKFSECDSQLSVNIFIKNLQFYKFIVYT